MQSTGAMPWMSFRKNPRNGQEQVFEKFAKTNYLNIQLPTGYGKTYTANGCYSIKKQSGECNRLLFIFPTDAQLEQFVKDGAIDLHDVNVEKPLCVIDIRFFKTKAIQKHRTDKAQVFAITVQSLIGSNGMDIVGDLMETGRWMIVVDEYHHYGIDAAWGKSVKALNSSALLAMSATPTRPGDDSAFGKPDVFIKYRDAMEEGAVKPLCGHSYVYRIDAVIENGDVISFTTDDLISEVGSDKPADIEAYKITRKMRWSAKYVSPLVTIPIERMLRDRISTGYKLQAIIGAMCVSHAELVCTQVKSLFPELSVDWVGTGDDGRTPGQNKGVLKRFCPPKDENGKRVPTIDILIHVGMAGEGLDSILVSEVIHLNAASKNNSNDQENGRAARFLPGVTGNINFDSTSEYSKKGFIGDAIMDAMDGSDAREPEDDIDRDESDEPDELPEEPTIQIWDMDLLKINSGDVGVQRMAEVAENIGVTGISYDDLTDKDSPEWDKVTDLYIVMRKREAEANDEKAVIMQWRDSVNNAASAVTGRIIRAMLKKGMRQEKSLAGDIKKRLMREKKMACGAISEDVSVCKKHYTWLAALDSQIIKQGVPQWLL